MRRDPIHLDWLKLVGGCPRPAENCFYSFLVQRCNRSVLAVSDPPSDRKSRWDSSGNAATKIKGSHAQ